MDASHCCVQCSYQTIWKFQLDYHIQRKHDNKAKIKPFAADAEPELYSCSSCDFQTRFKLAQFEHCTGQHGDATDTNTIDQSRREFARYSCNKCHRSWHAIIQLAEHSCKVARVVFTYKKTSKGFLCSQCPYGSPMRSRLRRHFLGKHVPDDQATWFSCTQCSYRCKFRRYNLTRHVALYHAADDRIPWFKCVECSYRSRMKQSLENHVVIKHARPEDVKWFGCTKCSYRAKFESYLVRHNVRMHDRVPSDNVVEWFDCTKCSFRTKIKRSLARHMLNHAKPDEIRWFSCSNCSYRAKAKATLKRHMLTHNTSDDDWYACTECHYRTIRKGYLKQHMQQQHGDADAIKWLSCPDCSYRAKQPASIKYHRLKEHPTDGETRTSFVCAICSFRTVHKISLKRHMITLHRDVANAE